MKVSCICIDDKNRPKEIPAKMWIMEGVEYTITHVYFVKNPNQYGIQGVLLEEVQIKDCSPYESYRLSRFAFTKENFQKLIELALSCSELDKINLEEMLKQEEIVIL